MNILHITLGFYPANGWGGPVKVVYDNGKELVRRGHRVTVYCTNLRDKKNKIHPGTFEQEIGGMRIVYFDTWNIRSWPGTLGPFWLPDLGAYLKREIATFDVVHLNGYRSLMTLQVARVARGAGVPVVIQPHGTLPIIVNSFLVKHLYDRLFGRMEIEGIGALIALQESERQQALAHGIPSDRIEIVPNGIDTEERQHVPEWGSFRRRYGLDLTRPLVLFLARINKKKGTDMLIEAFVRLKGSDAQLAVVGPDDGQLAEVQRLIQKHKLEKRVILPGLLSGQDVLAAFRDADLFVLPCRADTFPVTLMEACLMGTPMVITDRCEIAHLVQDRIAEVVPFDADAFAAAMERLLTDRERYDRYRTNCQEMLAHTFSVNAVVNRLEAVYERVTAETRKHITEANSVAGQKM
jgi:glycosyltransferase involved in cell wall biosynthesis